MDVLHVLNRGVDKRKVFLDDSDRLRFIHDLFAFNDTASVPNYPQQKRHNDRKRDRLVDIHAYALMPNHYHMLLSPVAENGIPLFIKKVNGGYSKYFNERYERVGALWQGKYRRFVVARGAHGIYIPFYIHLNPLDLSHPQWRQGKVARPKDALKALEKYRWSSHLDYLGVPNFPSVINTHLLKGDLSPRRSYEREIVSIITSGMRASESDVIE